MRLEELSSDVEGALFLIISLKGWVSCSNWAEEKKHPNNYCANNYDMDSPMDRARYSPISSAKPPTGSLHVPVTNCSSRVLFSLSISFKNFQNHWTCLLVLENNNAVTRYVRSQTIGNKRILSTLIMETSDRQLEMEDLSLPGVALIYCMLLPIFHIDLLHTAQHELQA